MAHVNTSGQHIALYLTGQAPVGWGTDVPHYPMQEGTFVGDLFPSPPVAKYCTGRGYGANTVAGRIGAQTTGAPYSAMIADDGTTRCDHACAMAGDRSGYYNCTVPGRPITVWRGLTRTPTFDFETGAQGW